MLLQELDAEMLDFLLVLLVEYLIQDGLILRQFSLEVLTVLFTHLLRHKGDSDELF